MTRGSSLRPVQVRFPCLRAARARAQPPRGGRLAGPRRSASCHRSYSRMTLVWLRRRKTAHGGRPAREGGEGGRGNPACGLRGASPLCASVLSRPLRPRSTRKRRAWRALARSVSDMPLLARPCLCQASRARRRAHRRHAQQPPRAVSACLSTDAPFPVRCSFAGPGTLVGPAGCLYVVDSYSGRASTGPKFNRA